MYIYLNPDAHRIIGSLTFYI